MGTYIPDRERKLMNPNEFGNTIREARRTLGLRQDELAGAAGVGLRFIVDLEAGKPTIQLGKALAVLEALGCDLTIVPPAPDKSCR